MLAGETSAHRVGIVLWRVFSILLFAVWWGGLTFYALIVVPIGTDQIGSVEQGIITQQVTRWHNAIVTLMTIVVLIEASMRKRVAWWSAGIGLAVVTALLFVTHWQLSGMMDFAGRTVPASFYRQHSVYLWLTAAEWATGIALAVLGMLPDAIARTKDRSSR
ncbi:hypothetical protein [Planctopirus hydrillae]|uniref:DUF4149 domain-containing protein n=1 Tax=Planctopirus hydrillae TaxID=1841610 RepID=A0A1C3ENR0_9PLAN|nr:hypothetical protein [Planctopirus hydrillae]ODA34893.1 hypothetical protein A6X21_04395 [Planctopirus hydrillae]